MDKINCILGASLAVLVLFVGFCAIKATDDRIAKYLQRSDYSQSSVERRKANGRRQEEFLARRQPEILKELAAEKKHVDFLRAANALPLLYRPAGSNIPIGHPIKTPIVCYSKNAAWWADQAIRNAPKHHNVYNTAYFRNNCRLFYSGHGNYLFVNNWDLPANAALVKTWQNAYFYALTITSEPIPMVPHANISTTARRILRSPAQETEGPDVSVVSRKRKEVKILRPRSPAMGQLY